MGDSRESCESIRANHATKAWEVCIEKWWGFLVNWRLPNPPGANPLVAERAPWRSSQSRVTGGQQPIGNPYRFLSHFFCTPGNPCATPIVTRGEGPFSYKGVSTRGVRHSPGEFFLVTPSPTKRSTKNPRKIRGKFGAKFGQNSGRKVEKFGKLSFCNFSDLSICRFSLDSVAQCVRETCVC